MEVVGQRLSDHKIKEFIMNTIKPILATASLALTLIGCATPQQVAYDEVKRPPTTSVDFFREGTKPTRQYKEIGEISVEDFGGEDANVTKQLIAKAKQLGGNGLIMLPRKETGYAFVPFARSGNKYLWKAVVIVYE